MPPPNAIDPIPVGKLPADLLRDLLDRYATADPRVVVGPAVGEDAAIIDMGDRYLVAKTDPVTFATDEIGWYAVHVNANDLACSGATPRWFLATLLLPESGTTPGLVETIFDQIAQACRPLGISLCGGHTEITYGLERPIVVGQMLGEVAPDGYVTSSGAQVGDALLLTKGIAVEGTALVAREKREELRGVLSDATGLWELAQAAGVGLLIEEERLPLLDECRAVCRHFGLDPLGLIGSGSLLIAAAKDRAAAIVRRIESEGIAAARIGEVVAADQGCRIRSADGRLRPLPTFPRDEIARLFE